MERGRGPGLPAADDVVRIGDKVIQRSRIVRFIDRLLELRAGGLSQLEAARALGVDRTVVSRLEAIGEVRRGPVVALIGFPIANRDELYALARERGVDFVLLMSNRERRSFVEEPDGASLFNRVLSIIAQVKRCDTLIFLGSDMRVRTVEEILGREKVLGVVLGPSPIDDDVYVDPARLAALIEQATL